MTTILEDEHKITPLPAGNLGPVCIHDMIRKDQPRPVVGIDPINAIIPIDHTIFWHIDERFITEDLQKYRLVLSMEKAFAEWQYLFYPLKIRSSNDLQRSQIVVRFMKSGHPDLPYAFEDRTLAYAFYPQKGSLGVHSDIYFNDAYAWDEIHKPDRINLFKVAVHEAGHSFGLDHSGVLADIMYPTYQPDNSVIINTVTAESIDKLYGRFKALVRVGTPTPPAPGVDAELRTVLKNLFSSTAFIDRLYLRQLDYLLRALGQGIPIGRNDKVRALNTLFRSW